MLISASHEDVQKTIAVQDSNAEQTSAMADSGLSSSAAEPTASVFTSRVSMPIMSVNTLKMASPSVSMSSHVPETSSVVRKATEPNSCRGKMSLWRPDARYENGSKVVYRCVPYSMRHICDILLTMYDRHIVFAAQQENQVCLCVQHLFRRKLLT